MGLEKVIDEITAQANGKKQQLLAEARKEADAVLDSAKQKQKELDEANSRETKTKVSGRMNRELSSLELRIRKEQLNARKQIMKEIEDKLKEKISSVSENEKLLSALIKKGRSELPEAKYIYSSSRDKGTVSRLAPKLTYAGPIDCLGGVVLEDAKHEIRINYTYDLLLEKVLEQNMHEIYRRVFD